MLFEIFDPKARPRPIGIDLGTTHSLVACVRNERPEAISDCDNEVLLPSVVAYLREGVIVGRDAKKKAALHPRETIVSVKRFMGRGANDPETRALGPYLFEDAKEGEANVVRFRIGDRSVTPVEVSAEILRTLKRLAEDELLAVGGAVITVPAYFDDAQRQATKDAGKLAGLEVLRLLNEPTAAALAYGLEKKKNGHFAVYDLGGGTFDITILFLEDGVFQVKSTGGDSALGGDDMDRLIAEKLFAQLDGVILVGGSTRVLAVRAYVKKIFGMEPLVDIDPDRVVALGAAIQADLLAGDGQRDDVLLLDVLPLSLGIEVGGGVVDKILPRNVTIPTGARATYTTQEDNQTGFEIHVVQGERELAVDGRSLARFTLKGIPRMAAGMAKLEVAFNVDADGLLSVVAKETTTGIEQTVSVKPTFGLDDEAVEKMLIDALDHGEDDLKKRRVAENRVEAERILAVTAKAMVADAALLISGEKEAISKAMSALSEAAKGSDATKMHTLVEALDAASKEFATRRMNRAIARAIEGRKVSDIAPSETRPTQEPHSHG
jgi:molecular chaperone DnaK (HSP70)